MLQVGLRDGLFSLDRIVEMQPGPRVVGEHVADLRQRCHIEVADTGCHQRAQHARFRIGLHRVTDGTREAAQELAGALRQPIGAKQVDRLPGPELPDDCAGVAVDIVASARLENGGNTACHSRSFLIPQGYSPKLCRRSNSCNY